jgi:Asp-tRNA(Asn)/Glu-tRNA(Gln) amidotransferase A subunit family amidase
VPIALKDIFDAAGVPTTAGAPAWATRTPAIDAPSVAALRGAGAVPMGKLATTPFAYLDPSATRNPWNPEHTPGGSSSGPAAAVAARMVPLALGSQTVGSVLRPAAYCGVVGLKPTHGRISAAGVLELAGSLDVGVFARRWRTARSRSRCWPRRSSARRLRLSGGDPVAPRLGVLASFLARRPRWAST